MPRQRFVLYAKPCPFNLESHGTDGNQLAIASEGNSVGRGGDKKDSKRQRFVLHAKPCPINLESRGTDGNQLAIAGEGNSAGRGGGKKDSKWWLDERNPHNDLPVYAVPSPNLCRDTDGNQLAIAGAGNSAGRDGSEMDSVVRGLDQILLGAGNHAGRDNKIVVTGNIFVLLKPDAGGGNHLPSPLIKGSTHTVAIKYDNV